MTSMTVSARLTSMAPGILVLLAMVMWLATELVGSLAFSGTPLPQIVWLRYACHLALMILVFGWRTRLSFVRTRRAPLHLARSMLMLIMPMCYVIAVQTTRGAAIFALFAVSPLLVIVLGRLAGERVPAMTWIIATIGWAGALILYRPSALPEGWGAIGAAGMTASYSGYIVLTRVLDRTERLLTNLFYSALGVFVALTLALPWFWAPIGVREVLAGATLASCGWIGLWLLELGLRRDPAPRLAPFLLGQPLLDGLFRAFDRGGVPPGAILVGGGLIVGAILAAFAIGDRRTISRPGEALKRAAPTTR